MKNNRNLVIYFGGGAITGVFGGGIASVFQKENLYLQIKAVYGASVGVMTGAFFLSRQTELGYSICCEDLNKNFILPKDFFVGAWQRFQNRFIKSIPLNNLSEFIKIEYLMEIIKNKKILDIDRIINQDIPLFVKLFNLDNQSIEFLDARKENILKILEAGINVLPYTHKFSVIDNKKYSDGGILDILSFDYLKETYPNDKIIFILNRHPKNDLKLSRKIRNNIEGKFMEWMFNDSNLYNSYSQTQDNYKRELEKAQKDKLTTIIYPKKDIGVKAITTQIDLIKKLYFLGIEEGKRFLKYLND